jgi:uncharacterized membrane protein
MMLYRKYVTIFVNLIIAIGVIKIVFYPKYSTDFFGHFLLIILGFWLLYGIYGIVLYNKFYRGEGFVWYIEAAFTVLLLLPILLLWRFTS